MCVCEDDVGVDLCTRQIFRVVAKETTHAHTHTHTRTRVHVLHAYMSLKCLLYCVFR